MKINLSTQRNAVAFTMIEIAIALAVIAFALVAIIGVLPTGINVQKDNREDTIVNQDGPYWIEAIRTGAKGLDHLTNFVDRIGVVLRPLDTNNTTLTTNYAQFDDIKNLRRESGSNIVGLLSLPKWSLYGSPPQYVVRVEAQTRALTGSAVEQGKANPEFSFSYLLQAEIAPLSAVQVPVASTNFLFNDPANDPPPADQAQLDAAVAARKAEWVRVKSRERNSTEIRLTFRWPLLANGSTGPNFQRFRVLASGAPSTTDPFPFLQPQSFVAVPAP